MTVQPTCPSKATQLLISILRSYPTRNGHSLQSVYRETGVDVSKYKSDGSTPLVYNVFKYGYSLGIEPAWLVVLASKTCQGNIDDEQLENLVTKFHEFSIAMNTAFDMAVKEVAERM